MMVPRKKVPPEPTSPPPKADTVPPLVAVAAEIIPLPWITPRSVALPLTETPATFSTDAAVTVAPLFVAPKPDTTVPIALPGP
jgi:hypothetical protein